MNKFIELPNKVIFYTPIKSHSVWSPTTKPNTQLITHTNRCRPLQNVWHHTNTDIHKRAHIYMGWGCVVLNVHKIGCPGLSRIQFFAEREIKPLPWLQPPILHIDPESDLLRLIAFVRSEPSFEWIFYKMTQDEGRYFQFWIVKYFWRFLFLFVLTMYFST